jgi:hypothetical protein
LGLRQVIYFSYGTYIQRPGIKQLRIIYFFFIGFLKSKIF